MRLWIYSILAGAMLAMPVAASAQGFRGMDSWQGRGPRLLAMLENDRVKSALGLTDEQSGKLRQIMVESRKSAIKARAD
jgi:hypothetical protein